MHFVEGMTYEDFARDKKTVYAITRAIEIIGEAAKKVPAPVGKRYQKIPWRAMTGMRDKLVHAYFGVDLTRVWNTVKNDIPNLKPLFETVLKDSQP
jgi:uncharacterized protein with HEPN domain